MRIVGALHVRGAADVIELAVRHNLTVLDALVVVAGEAADGTRGILAALAAEGLPLVICEDADPLATDAALAARAARDAEAGEPGWVIPLAAADFLSPPSRIALEAALASVGTAAAVALPRHLRIPDFRHPASDATAALAAAHRVDAPPGAAPCVARSQRDGDNSVATAMAANPSSLAIATVPVRSREQLVAEITVAYLAALAVGAPAGEGTWLETVYREIRSGRALTPDFLDAAAVNAGLARGQWRDPHHVAREASSWLAPVACHHTPPRAPFPLAQVLALGERLAGTEAVRAAAHLLHGKDAAAALAGRPPATGGTAA